MEKEKLVKIEELERVLDVPRHVIYRRLKDPDFPRHEVTESYHKRRQFRFRVSEVKAYLDSHQRPEVAAALGLDPKTP